MSTGNQPGMKIFSVGHNFIFTNNVVTLEPKQEKNHHVEVPLLLQLKNVMHQMIFETQSIIASNSTSTIATNTVSHSTLSQKITYLNLIFHTEVHALIANFLSVSICVHSGL